MKIIFKKFFLPYLGPTPERENRLRAILDLLIMICIIIMVLISPEKKDLEKINFSRPNNFYSKSPSNQVKILKQHKKIKIYPKTTNNKSI